MSRLLRHDLSMDILFSQLLAGRGASEIVQQLLDSVQDLSDSISSGARVNDELVRAFGRAGNSSNQFNRAAETTVDRAIARGRAAGPSSSPSHLGRARSIPRFNVQRFTTRRHPASRPSRGTSSRVPFLQDLVLLRGPKVCVPVQDGSIRIWLVGLT